MTIRSYKRMAFVLSIAVLSLFAIVPVSSFGQEMSTGAKPAVTIDLSQPNDSPLRLTRTPSVSNNSFGVRVENVGQAPILAYVIATRGANGNTGDFLTTVSDNWLLPGSSQQQSIPVWANDTAIAFVVDYVRFAGGGSWGADTGRMSDRLDGQVAGRQAAVERLKELVSIRDSDALSRLLNTDPAQIDVAADPSRSDKWRGGYISGYRTVILWLAQYRDEGEESVLAKLASLQ